MQMMSDIYHEAVLVIAWLGLGTVESDEAIDKLWRVGEKGLSLVRLRSGDAEEDWPWKLWEEETNHRYIVELMQRAYFCRVWIIQKLHSQEIFCFGVGRGSFQDWLHSWHYAYFMSIATKLSQLGT